MNRFIKRAVGPLKTNHAASLISHVHKYTLVKELQDATSSCEALFGQADWQAPLGHSAALTSTRELQAKMDMVGGPDAVVFGGVLQ